LALAAAAIALTTACPPETAPTRSPGSVDAAKGIELIQLRYQPRTVAASSYGEAVEHRLTEIEAKLLESVAGGNFVHDPALSRMTRDLAASTPSRLDMPPGLVDGLLAWNGLADAPPQVLVVEISEGECAQRVGPKCSEPLEALAEEVRAVLPEAGSHVRLGIGGAVGVGERTRLMVTLIDRAFELQQPISVVQRAGARFTVRGRLVGPRREPELHVVDPDGRWRKVPGTVGSDGSLSATLNCPSRRGAIKVEVLAQGPFGPEVAANFPVLCGVGRGTDLAFTVERVREGVSSDTLARENFHALNEARVEFGLPALVWDDRAAGAALAHSEDMIRSGFVGHVSPTTGDATHRLARAGIANVTVRENVARGYGPRSIHESLMGSPGHRANIVARDVTHVGIGVAVGDPESSDGDSPRPIFLTQKFYAQPGADAPADLRAGMRSAVDARGRTDGFALRWDDRLSAMAQSHADGLAGGGTGIDPDELRTRIAALGLPSVTQHQVESGSFRALVQLDLWPTLQARRVGYGIARVRGNDAIMLVIFVAG
jgi:uncharacterized protein YkwD